MKKILLALLIFMPTVLQAQSFGDDFMDWVKNQANAKSQQFVTNHWKLYWNNHYITLHDTTTQQLIRADSILSRMTNDNDRSIIKLDTSSIEQFIQLKTLSTAQLAQLYVLVGQIDVIMNRMKTNAKSFDAYQAAGYHHYGTTSLMESYAALKNGASNIQSSYSVTFTQKSGPGDDKPGEANVSAYGSAFDAKNDVEQAIVGTGTALLASPDTEVYGMAILTAYGLYKLYGAYQFERQIRILEDAFLLLPSKMLSAEQTYDIYEASYQDAKLQFDSLQLSRTAVLQKMSEIATSLIAYNFQRISMMDNILNAKKVELIAANYSRDPGSFNNLFEHKLIKETVDEVYNFSKEVRQLELAALENVPLYEKLRRTEAVTDAKIEYSGIIKSFMSKAELLPIYPDMDETLNYMQLTANVGEDDSASEKAVSQKKVTNSLKKLLKNLGRKSLLNQKSDDIFSPQLAMVNNYIVEDYSFSFFNLKGSFGLGNFYLSTNATGDSYSRNFQNGEDVQGSPYDGGYKYDRRSPSTDLGKMKGNMNLRINDMVVANNSITSLRPTYLAANMNAGVLQLKNVDGFNQKTHVSSEMNRSLNAGYVDAYRSGIEDFASKPITLQRLQNFFGKHQIGGTHIRQIPVRNIRPNGYTSKLFDLKGQVYKDLNAAQRDIFYEANKMNASLDAVANRFKVNTTRGERDPVFGDEKSLKETISLAKAYLLTAAKITDAKNPYFINQKALARNTAKMFIENARMLRYYSEGLLPEYKLNEGHFYVDYPEIRKQLARTATDFYSFCDENTSLERSDCNKFSTYFLKDIYGVGDFYNQPTGHDFVVRDGARIPIFNTTQMAAYVQEKWIDLGPAGDQLTLDAAGLYAGMGYAVLALKPGHVAVILPTDPTNFHESGWGLRVPNILNYRRTNETGAPLEILLNVPLSEGWGSPNGVRIYIKPQSKDYL